MIEWAEDSFSRSPRKFFIDSGAEVSIIKEDAVNSLFAEAANTTVIYRIQGITVGACIILDSIKVNLQSLECFLHIVSSSVPMEADGLLGWDIINKYKGVIDAAEQKLMLDNKVIPFFNKDIIDLPPRMRKVIKARAFNDEPVGWVPLQHLKDGILFGNFVGQNRDGWIFAECLNTTEEFLSIPIPWVELIPCETVSAHENIDAGEDINKLQDSFIFSLATDNAAESAPSEPQSNLSLEGRKKKIFDLMDTEGCSEEELAAVRELIEHSPYVFGLDGEPLPISNIIKCSITTTSEKPFTPKHYRYPPKIKDQMQKEIDKLLKGDIILKFTTPWLSPLWIVPKKTVDQSGNKKQQTAK
uniref:Peptidase A2 domain-containing protein n=1 Tax=Trichogramma kaykai TaxID=54128 RepID=A0ABD2WZK0_9HYME